MGQIKIKRNRIIILICLFLFAGVIVLIKPASVTLKKNQSLSDALKEIPGWENLGSSSFDDKIVNALALDEYINTRYSSGGDSVSLYIGYYHSAKKVGAAHDPMVCFPGQGWKISNKRADKLRLDDGEKLNYSIMQAELGNKKELIVYWFQANDTTNSNTFYQKMHLLWGKLLHRGEDNAFVRVTIPINGDNIEIPQMIALKFIKRFYPQFLSFLLEKKI